MRNWKNIKVVFYISIVLHLIAAYFSAGPLHADEHYQILEFMNFKLGGISLENMPWEYKEQMRPWFQPLSYYYFYQFLSFFSPIGPLTFATILRLTSSAIGLYATFCTYQLSKDLLKQRFLKSIAPAVIFLFWCFPYLHARISGEALGGSLFIIGLFFFITQLKKPENGSAILLGTGLIFGCSFQARYHIGIMVASIIIWAFFSPYQNAKKKALTSLFGVLLSFALFALVDYQGYQQFSFPPFNYLYQNLFMDKASSWGTAPWYNYFRDILKTLLAPLGIVTILSSLFIWKKKPFSWLTIVTLPFFIIHSYVSHKEWRFLIPLAHFAPLIILYTADRSLAVQLFLKFHNARKIFFASLIIPSVFALFVSSFKPAHSYIKFYDFLSGYKDKIGDTYIIGDDSPFNMAGLTPSFYLSSSIKITKVKSIAEMKKMSLPTTYWIHTKRGNDLLALTNKEHCSIIYMSLPRFLLKYNFNNWINKTKVNAFFKCYQN